jgi:hypothetical protein
MDEEDKKFFTSLPTCYAMFLHSTPGMIQKVIAPLQGTMKAAKNDFIQNNSFWV